MSNEQLSELQRTFVPPAQLKESRPRDVQLTRLGRVLFVLALLLFTGAIVAFAALTRESARQAANRVAIAERGVVTSGVVTKLWKDGDDRRKVAYAFEAEGREFKGDINVSTERRRTLQVGSAIDVRYLPGKPEVNDLGGTPRRGLPAAVAPIVALGLTLGGALFLVAIRIQRRLLEDGRVAPAIVTAHKTDKGSHGKHYSMTYSFPLISGAVADGKAGTSSKRPAIGSVITVIYDPERPKRSRIYPLSLVKPA